MYSRHKKVIFVSDLTSQCHTMQEKLILTGKVQEMRSIQTKSVQTMKCLPDIYTNLNIKKKQQQNTSSGLDWYIQSVPGRSKAK